MSILISACILGQNCKFNGKNNRNDAALRLLKDQDLIPICPETLGGMPTPRPCAELVHGIVTDETGCNVHKQYEHAVQVALSHIEDLSIDYAILQSRSPTCGVNQIYDGSFSGKLVSGMGLFAKALREKGILVIDVQDLLSI